MLVSRAIASVLAQTARDLEVIVIVDGPDAETVSAVSAHQDHRVRLIQLESSRGGSIARNTGVGAARAPWVAFLDDDDEWLPHKLEAQLQAAQSSESPSIIACQFIHRDPLGDRVLPQRNLGKEENFSEFLFCRKGLTGGVGYVQTSTWLVSRLLMLDCPFTPGLKRNQDVDWLLRAMKHPQARFQIVWEPLAVFNCLPDPRRVSKSADWRFHLNWTLENRQLFTPKSLTCFLATVCMEDAARQQNRVVALPRILNAIWRYGRVDLGACLLFAYYALIPESTRRRARNLIAARRSGSRRNPACA
jgi:glycosyltransferase involved in cell wall biosynthesis